MGGGPKAPAPDPELVAARQREEQRLADEKKAREEQAAADAAARERGLRGRRSLFSGSELGFTDTLG